MLLRQPYFERFYHIEALFPLPLEVRLSLFLLGDVFDVRTHAEVGRWRNVLIAKNR